MPLAVVVTPAQANDGCQTHRVLAALVVKPPAGEPVPTPDERGRPMARADGAYGNGPSRDRAASQGFRLRAPGRGRKRPGLGKVRNAVERCHNFLAQFGRVGRRLDRDARRYLSWCQMAACIVFVRSGFVR
jgi:transposase